MIREEREVSRSTEIVHVYSRAFADLTNTGVHAYGPVPPASPPMAPLVSSYVLRSAPGSWLFERLCATIGGGPGNRSAILKEMG